MTRDELAREIIAILGTNELVYGEFVRDNVAKVPFKKINIFASSTTETEAKTRTDFLKKLQDRFGSFSISKEEPVNVTDNSISCVKQKIRITDKDNTKTFVDLELVTNTYNDPFVHIGADVNALLIKNGALSVAPSFSIDKIKENITKRVYEPVPGRLSYIQATALTDEGYTPKEKPAPVPEKIVSVPEKQVSINVPVVQSTTKPVIELSDKEKEELLKAVKIIKENLEKNDVDPYKVQLSEEQFKEAEHYTTYPTNKQVGEAFKKNVENIKQSYIQEEKKVMTQESEANTFMDRVKDDAIEAAYRVAAHQMVQAVKTALVKALNAKKVKKSQVQAASDLLNSEAGYAVIAMALGTALNFAPGISEDPRAKKLSAEFRVNGMTAAGNLLIDEALGNILPSIMGALNNLPALEGNKTRITDAASIASITPSSILKNVTQSMAIPELVTEAAASVMQKSL